MHGMRWKGFLGFLSDSGVNLRQAGGLLLPKIRTPALKDLKKAAFAKFDTMLLMIRAERQSFQFRAALCSWQHPHWSIDQQHWILEAGQAGFSKIFPPRSP